MSTVSNYTQYIGKGVMAGYTSIIPPFLCSGRPATGVGGAPITSAGIGDVVRLGLASAATKSIDFTYATGYSTTNNGQINFKTATLNICKAQPFQFTDTEILQLGSQDASFAQGIVLGKRLAADVLSASYASVISATNYPNSSSAGSASRGYVAADFSSASMVALADLDNQANAQNWPDDERFLVAGYTLWNYLLQNTGVIAASNFGFNSIVAQTAQLRSVYGFTPYKTSLTLPNSDTGFACTPNAMALTTVYHQPQDAATKVIDDAFEIRDDKTGVTLGYYAYYSPATRTITKVFDCLAAVTTLDPTALLHIK